MNYDHAYHAGNFADVLKHVVLTRILLYLQRKPAPFRVIDTHAGRGAYDLKTQAPRLTQEWRAGIGRLDANAMDALERELISPYLDAVGKARSGEAPYPGSPVLALRFTRPFDRMIFNELHPSALVALRRCVGRDRRAKTVALDGYVALNASIPPVERRGLVIVDPPFESADEFERLAAALAGAHAKWREGVMLAWYPIKDRRGVERIAATIARARMPDVLRCELSIGRPAPDGPLAACGLVIVNPPYTLDGELGRLLPLLARQLGAGAAAWRLDRVGTG